jgi:hypothetical protein
MTLAVLAIIRSVSTAERCSLIGVKEFAEARAYPEYCQYGLIRRLK